MGIWAGASNIGYAHEIQTWGEFVTTGVKLFDSEDMTDALLRLYLGMSANGWASASRATRVALEGFGDMYAKGLWLPCIERVCLPGSLDVRNDGIVPRAAIPICGKTFDDIKFVIAKRIERPKRFSFPPSDDFYSITVLYRDFVDRGLRRNLHKDIMKFDGWYYALSGDRLLPGRHRDGSFPNGGAAGLAAIYGAAALQTVADFRHMWVVETEENVIGSTNTPLRLGVDSEIIKSLFYARQAPLSESGRRKPILHWVRSHLRRLQSGVDIDVQKHLRGITSFEMDGFAFKISQPTRAKSGGLTHD